MRVGGNGYAAAATKAARYTALGHYSHARVEVVDRDHEVAVADARLQGNRALPRLGHEHLDGETEADLVVEPDAVKPTRGKDHAIEIAR